MGTKKLWRLTDENKQQHYNGLAQSVLGMLPLREALPYAKDYRERASKAAALYVRLEAL